MWIWNFQLKKKKREKYVYMDTSVSKTLDTLSTPLPHLDRRYNIEKKHRPQYYTTVSYYSSVHIDAALTIYADGKV